MCKNKHLTALCLLAVLCCVTPLRAQDYPFIRPEANCLHYDSTSLPMLAFFQKFHHVCATGQGSISIMHIGGSHVQAGTLPHRIRTNILNAYPTLVRGRGLLFPYSAAAKCNNPADYKVHCLEKVILTRNVYKQPEYPMGLCGISVTAHDMPTSIQILSNEKEIDYGVSRVVVLGYTPDGIVPYLRYDDNNTPPSYIDTNLHRYVFNLRQEVDSIDIIIPCQEGQQFTLTGVLLDSRHPGITYHSIGVNGAAVPDYLKCALTNDLRLIRPDLVIFGIGINDAHGTDFDSVAFKNNYLRLCDSIRSVNPKCAFVFITNNDCYRKTGRRSYSVNRNGLQVREVCYRLAELTGGAVWDQFEIMGGLQSMEKWQKAGLAQKDKVHFTRSGYQLLGDMFSQALMHELDNSRSLYTPPPASSKQHSTQSKNNSQKPSNISTEERPLPRGLRRKPKTKRVNIEATPSESNTSNSASSRDRFPYIPD
ncbi:MAG: hypothetical protein IJM33_03935 [Bacteroidales bacterium]|nr:hypothetical protein [Bacteroidales bacterium]